MSGWDKKDLSQASYREIEFDFVDITDGLKKTVAKYDYPYANGSDLEDMGLEARTVQMKAIFMGDKYPNLIPFLEALEMQGPGMVVHPVFDSFMAIPETVSVREDERAYYAEVDISFVEHKDLAIFSDSLSVNSKATETSGQNSDINDEVDKNLNDSLAENGIPETIPTAGLGESGFMSTISGYASKVRDAMKKINTVVSTVKGYINKATEPFKLVSSVVSYATNLPGSILSSFASGIESVAGAYMSLLNAPGKFMDSLNYGLGKIEDALGDFGGDSSLKAAWYVCKASALSSAAAIELAADEATENGTSLSLKVYGSDSEVSRTQLMTIDEVDAAAAAARTALQQAIDSVREAFGKNGYDLEAALKAQALNIHQMADIIRLKREKIIEYEVASPTSLHLIAYTLYGDLNEAERLLRINNIINPNFIEAGKVLRVYA